MSLPRPPLINLLQPWHDDDYPELWVTSAELCQLCGFGEGRRRHAGMLLKVAQELGIRVWYNRSEALGRGVVRYFFRLGLQDLDSIRKLREENKKIQKLHRARNPIERFLDRRQRALEKTAIRLA